LQVVVWGFKEANIRAVQNSFREEGILNRQLVSQMGTGPQSLGQVSWCVKYR